MASGTAPMEEAFRSFVAGCGDSLMGTAYVLTSDRHLAEDLLQTVLTKVASNWSRIREPAKAEAYARTALVREFISWRRVRRNQEVPTDRLPDDVRSDFTAGTIRKLALERALDQLTARQRAVITLRYYEDRTIAETASLLRCKRGTVKRITFDALNRLRQSGPELADLLSDTEFPVVVSSVGVVR